MLFLQATYPYFLALASPDIPVTYIGYPFPGAIYSLFGSLKNVQGPHRYQYQNRERTCPISSPLHKLISNLDHGLSTREDASGTIGIALSLKDFGWPNGILLHATVLGEQNMQPMLQFCRANTKGDWSFHAVMESRISPINHL